MKYQKGFTVIELLIIVAVATVASIFFFIQKSDLEVSARDSQRKTAINAIYYSLEEVYFKENSSYPRTITDETLRSIDPEILVDPFGIKINESDSDYRYEASNCGDDDKCKEYTIKAILEAEDDFIKTNRKNN